MRKLNRNFDSSFKNLVRTMWSNYVIQVFILCSTLLTLQIFNLEWCIIKLYESINDGTATAPAQITVPWAKPDGTGNNTTQYFITQNSNDAQYAKYPMDIEYFQVITAITINEYVQLSNSVPYGFPSFEERIINGYTWINKIRTSNDRWLEPPIYSYYKDCYENWGEQIIVFMVRGVDPYSTRGEITCW